MKRALLIGSLFAMGWLLSGCAGTQRVPSPDLFSGQPELKAHFDHGMAEFKHERYLHELARRAGSPAFNFIVCTNGPAFIICW